VRYKAALKSHFDKLESNVINSGNVRTFFSFANKNLKNRSSHIGPIKRNDNSLTVDPFEKCSLFNDYFCGVFTVDNRVVPEFPDRVKENEGINTVPFPVSVVAKKLRHLPDKFSRTPDGIPAYYWKRVSESVACVLCRIFELSMESGSLPSVWKDALVCPIFKKGLSSAPGNYRPVSLTCICCKIMESVIYDAILKYLRAKRLIADQQYGFLAGRSVGLQLFSTLSEWISAIEKRQFVDAIYIDFAKAFDSVSHCKLQKKLRAYGIGYELFQWLTEFLSGRRQSVVVDDLSLKGQAAFSGFAPVTSGVPQGTVLGPLLFLLYINDLPECLGPEASVKLFADDAKIYAAFDPDQSVVPFQDSLNSFCRWADDWQLNIAMHKCSTLSMGFNNPGNEYSLNNVPLNSVSSIRDLGVMVSKDLKFSIQCDTVAAKALNRAAMLFRAFRTVDMSALLRAYVSYVRPLLEFETFVWSPHYQKDIDRIEKVQRTFSRRLYERCMFPGVDYTTRVKELGLTSLEERRAKNDLVMCYKLFNGLVDESFEKFFSLSANTRTRGNGAKLEKPIVRLDIAKHFLTSRVIDKWNSLPVMTVSSSSVNVFRDKL
jgi:hypothetical protein